VAFIAAGAERYQLRDGGLRDVAPTILDLLGIPAPGRMTGTTLLAPR
jgi:2,3-bisphosphoglycerate-independent phosphoglycerate mutase